MRKCRLRIAPRWRTLLRIALVSTGSPEYDAPPRLGGIQKQIRGFASSYVRLGHHVDVITRDVTTGERQDADYVRRIRVRSRNDVLSRLLFSRRAASMVDELEPDVIELHERFSGFFPSRLKRRKVFFARNYDAMRYYVHYGRSRRSANWAFLPVKNWMEEECMRHSDLVFALNQRDAVYLRSRGFEWVELTRNAVDPDLFRSGEDGNYILFAGRLDAVKGVRVLTEAFELLAKVTDIDLHVAGDGPLRAELERWGQKPELRGRVRILGWLETSDLATQYSNCSFLVLPSFFETFGNVAIEAMASGKPVVASRIPGPGEVIQPGRTGFLFTAGNSEELAQFCRVFVEDPGLRRKFGASARQDAEKRYSFLAVASDRLQTYDRLIVGHP